jgi:hypothetical protein
LAVDAGRRLRRREVGPVGGDGGVGVAPVRNYNRFQPIQVKGKHNSMSREPLLKGKAQYS